MPVGPIGSMLYTNQNMNAAAVKQSDFQNRLDMQSVVAMESSNDNGKEVKQIRPMEETYKVDPDKEHEKHKNDDTPEQKKEDESDEKIPDERDKDKGDKPSTSHLDISV